MLPIFGTATCRDSRKNFEVEKISLRLSVRIILTQKFLKKNKKKVRESRGFQNLSKSLIFSVRRESCERGFSWPNIAVTFLELKFGEVVSLGVNK